MWPMIQWSVVVVRSLSMALRPACGVQSGAERMFLSGVAHQPIERTLLTGGLVEVRGHGLQMQSLWINPYC